MSERPPTAPLIRGRPVMTPDGAGVIVGEHREPGWQPFAGRARPERVWLIVELRDGTRRFYPPEEIEGG